MEATNVMLRLPKPGLQYVIICDASYRGAGFVLTYVNETGKKEKKTNALGSPLFSATQLNFSIYYK